jgi:hypothetical protein
MKKIVMAALCAVALAACDRIVSDQPVGEAYLRNQTDSCSYPGVCMTCMYGMGFDGKMSNTCAVKFSPFCPGSQPVEALVQNHRITRESGKAETLPFRVKTVRTLGACS